ncbi:hypothetical protein CsSME_00011742 [Camellia sinensis var. sinensis]
MAKHLRDLLSAERVSDFCRHFSVPNDVHLSLLAENVIDTERTDESIIVFPLLSIAKGGGRYFLRGKDTDHHLVTMLTSSGKRVDDVMVVVRGNWEFGDGEDRQDPVPRRRGEPGGRNNLKKVLISTDDAILAQIKTALQFFGRPNLQKQGRAAHILLRYEPTYTTFSAAENILIPRGEQHLTALIFLSFKGLRQIGFEASDSEPTNEQAAEGVTEQPNQPSLDKSNGLEEVDAALNLAFEEASLNHPSTYSRANASFEDIYIDLKDLPGSYPDSMAGQLLT